MVIGKCTDVFRGLFFVLGVGLRGETMWEDLSLEKYVLGEQKFNEKREEFFKITIKKTMKKNAWKGFSI